MTASLPDAPDQADPIFTIIPGRLRYHRQRLELQSEDGHPIPLRPQAARVLEVLLANAGRVVGRDELFAAVWPGVVVTDDSLVQCISDIRAALGAHGHDLVRTVPRRGYRLDLPATGPGATQAAGGDASVPDARGDLPVPPDATPASRSAQADAMPVPALDQPRLTGRVLSARRAVVMGMVLVLVAAGLVWRPGADTGRKPAPALAVLPFQAAVGSDAQVALGLADDLANDLARNVDLRVVSPRSSFAAAAGGGDVQAMATRLGARFLVDGRLAAPEAAPDALRLRVQLIDGREGHIVWTDEQRVTVATLAQQREALLHRIAGTLRASMAWEQKRLALGSPPEALDSYTRTLRALALKHRMTPDGIRAARIDATEVLRREPDYAPAQAVLGYVNVLDAGLQLTGEWPASRLGEGIEQLKRAIELDGELPLAWQGLAVALNWTPRKAEAVAAADRALALAPGDGDTRAFRALALVYVERYEEALADLRLAMELHPIAPPYIETVASLVHFANERHADALRHAEACLASAPRLATCLRVRALALAGLGRVEEARGLSPALGRADPTSLVGRAGAMRERLVMAIEGATARRP